MSEKELKESLQIELDLLRNRIEKANMVICVSIFGEYGGTDNINLYDLDKLLVK